MLVHRSLPLFSVKIKFNRILILEFTDSLSIFPLRLDVGIFDQFFGPDLISSNNLLSEHPALRIRWRILNTPQFSIVYRRFTYFATV